MERIMQGMRIVMLVTAFVLFTGDCFAVQRFPKPEFESGYEQPQTLLPSPRAEILAIMDVFVLVVALAAVTWMVLKRRSRLGVFLISLFSLIYFGFYREGCVCSVGSIQNVTLALFDPTYILPMTVVAFFLIPLLFTHFFGRTFCAGVCPFGAIQDLVALRPQPLGSRLNAVLGLLPYIYLGLAILYAATGTDFIICRYDPFVGIFRFNASFGMFLFAGGLLLSGIFIARPYCRFLCPYGVILNWISRFSRKHMTITPAECIQCRLCEKSCPYDAIKIPVTAKNPESRTGLMKKLILISLLLPFLMFAGGWAGSHIHETLAGVNKTVRLSKELIIAEKDIPEQTRKATGVTARDPAGGGKPPNNELRPEQPESFELKAFRSSGKPALAVYTEAIDILHRFFIGGWILGGFIGLVTGLMIAGRLISRYNPDYVPHKGNCFSCGKCMDYCPVRNKL